MAKQQKEREIMISPPNFKTAHFKIVAKTPLVMHKFSQKTRNELKEKYMAGSKANKGKKREAKNFEAEYEQAIHRSESGWIGFPASGFRKSMISACRVAGFKMTHAKLAIFVEHDGIDSDEGTPLVRINGEPKVLESLTRVGMNKPDVVWRPIFKDWSAELRIRYDADLFSAEDVANLLMRAGLQVGIGEGRPDSPMSAGMDWGMFELEKKKK